MAFWPPVVGVCSYCRRLSCLEQRRERERVSPVRYLFSYYSMSKAAAHRGGWLVLLLFPLLWLPQAQQLLGVIWHAGSVNSDTEQQPGKQASKHPLSTSKHRSQSWPRKLIQGVASSGDTVQTQQEWPKYSYIRCINLILKISSLVSGHIYIMFWRMSDLQRLFYPPFWPCRIWHSTEPFESSIVPASPPSLMLF